MEDDVGALGTLLGFCAFVRQHDLPVGTDDAMTFASAAGAARPRPARRCLLVRPGDTRSRQKPDSRSTTNASPSTSSAGTPRSDQPTPQQLSARGVEAVFDVPSGGAARRRRGSERDPTRCPGVSGDREPLESLRRLHRRGARLFAANHRNVAIRPSASPHPPPSRSANRARRMDLRRMARETMRSHGEPGELWWRQRRQRPRPLVLILDISGSMADYSRNLLQFAHSTRTATSRVEAFCFGTHLTRITPSLRRRKLDEALASGRRGGRRLVGWDPNRRLTRRVRPSLRQDGGWPVGPSSSSAPTVSTVATPPCWMMHCGGSTVCPIASSG